MEQKEAAEQWKRDKEKENGMERKGERKMTQKDLDVYLMEKYIVRAE